MYIIGENCENDFKYCQGSKGNGELLKIVKYRLRFMLLWGVYINGENCDNFFG